MDTGIGTTRTTTATATAAAATASTATATAATYNCCHYPGFIVVTAFAEVASIALVFFWRSRFDEKPWKVKAGMYIMYVGFRVVASGL